ncbi:aspartic proteinase CDR1-like [Papaver somniferum]|uniref:aspartic proteinase CDR1-like n=1 Tax=Papaver somniferum TaxID=3469 RepID=UPI000E6F6F90|nr:aspartic proteinase CDR1-like [Papaver somniferum]
MCGMTTLFILLLTILFHISLLLNSVIAVNPSGFSMKIFHRDSKESPLYPGDHLTQEERFERLIQQSKNRARYIGLKISSSNNSINPRFPVTYDGVGAYVAAVGIGTFVGSRPYKQHYLMVDTGSELTWIQCQGAISSFPQEQPLYPATNSSTYQPLRCKKRRKGSIENPDCYRGFCDDQGMCTYETSYEDGAITSGKLAKEKFSVNSDNHRLDSFIIVMGCALNQVNFVFGSRLEVFSGYLGLNGGSKSLLKQLNLRKFEYCLRPYTDGRAGTDTYLRFGSDTRLGGEIRQAYRTGIYDFGTGHYYLVLDDISVNGSSVGFEREDFEYNQITRRGGCLIDSGTAFTFMRGRHFGRVAEKVREHFRKYELDPVIPSPFNSLELCFPRNRKRFEFPTITYHFLNANFELKKDEPDTAFAITEDYVCLGLIRAPEDDPYDVMFGAMQQARKRILYDVAGESLYFAEEDCGQDNMQSI